MDAARQGLGFRNQFAKNQLTHLVTQTFDLFRIGGVPEALGEVEEFLPFEILTHSVHDHGLANQQLERTMRRCQCRGLENHHRKRHQSCTHGNH